MEKQRLNEILIVVGIFLIAVAMRMWIIQYNHLFEYDAYFHTRMTWDLLIHGVVNNPDTMAYFQEGGAPQTFVSWYWIITAGIYQIFITPFFGIDKALFTKLAQSLPILWGALISVVAYFVGRDALNDYRIGGVMGFIAAVTPAFIYRTMAGAQGDNSFGFLPFILGIYFLIKTFREDTISTKSIIYSILAGAMFVVMVFSWNMFPLIVMVGIPGALFIIWHKVVSKNPIQNAMASSLISFGMFFGATFIKGIDALHVAGWYAGVSGWVVLVAIIISIIVISLFYIYLNILNKTMPINKKFLIGAVFLLLFIIPMGLFASVGDITDRNTVGSLVGEESIGHMFFLSKYNFFALLPFIALLLLPICMINKSETKNKWALIFFSLILFVTLIMGWYKLKFTFALGFGMIFASGIVSYCLLYGIDFLKKLEDREQKFVIGICTIILLLYVFAGANFILDYTPQVDREVDFIELIDWMRTTSKDSKFFIEWGAGHILTYETERAVSADNRNHSQRANALYAEFNLTTDVERGYDIIHNEIGADYVILSKDNASSFGGYVFYYNNAVDYSLISKYSVGTINQVSCSLDEFTANCGGQQIQLEEFYNMTDIYHTNVNEFYSDNTPLYFYRFWNSIIVLNQPINESNFAKVFFESEKTLDMYELVFDSSKYRVFKVLK